MKTTLIASTIAAVTMTGVFSASAIADDDEREMAAIAAGLGFISAEEAATKALAAKPGVVTEVDLDDRSFSKGWDYEVEIVDTDGAEWEVYVDAKSGAVRKVSRDWF